MKDFRNPSTVSALSSATVLHIWLTGRWMSAFVMVPSSPLPRLLIQGLLEERGDHVPVALVGKFKRHERFPEPFNRVRSQLGNSSAHLAHGQVDVGVRDGAQLTAASASYSGSARRAW
ncbi:unnamed protein product [Prorocentrum cordatum]|uniref:Uncharacterized protein n=1 Tax=Prorocentrum cordatum TaxID=2364126 RepID=A0ABN9V8U7_9DINO|nr:unnamed protein product [Polarella glacialis]